MEEMVKVSMLGNHSFRPGKGQETVHYKMGINEMPISHARAMGMLNRIVRVAELGESAAVQRVPFEGRFDERLTATLQGAGFNTLTDLAQADQSVLMAIEGIGPAAYEKIHAAIHGA